MIVRKLLIASFGAAVFMSAFAVTEVSAARAGKCKAADKPQCNLVLRADCTKQTKCGCQKWVCKL
jgi:hypothetical protein